MGFPSVARDGTVVCAGLPRAGAGQLILVSRDGTVERSLGDPMPELGSPAFSSDGRRILFVASEQQSRDVYLLDLDDDRKTRLTTTPEPEDHPVWIPPGRRIAFSAPAESCRAVFAMNADGTGTREPLAKSASTACFHPDGREFVYETMCEDRRGLNRMVVGAGAPIPLVDAPAGIDSPALSPDGRYLAFRNWEGGNPQIYVSRYPSMDGRWFVAATDSPPRWSSGGSEILFVDGQSGRMISVPVKLDPVFSTGAPKPLFDVAALAPTSSPFDVTADGKRFALVREKEGDHPERRILVIENAF
jgi:Tol biopolymer transport system component